MSASQLSPYILVGLGLIFLLALFYWLGGRSARDVSESKDLIIKRRDSALADQGEEIKELQRQVRHWKSEADRFKRLVDEARESEFERIIPKQTPKSPFQGEYTESMFPYPLGSQGPIDMPVRARLQIRYKDAKGNDTERLILTKSIFQEPGVTEYYLDSFCSLRSADRVFAVSRIRRCEDTESGEVILIKDIVDHLKRRYLAET